MSGIYCVLNFRKRPVDRILVESALEAMPTQGGDGQEVWLDGSIGLGHMLRRDTWEDDYDQQPLEDKAARIYLVADTRLDNREELARQLDFDASALPTVSDSSLILAAYKKWGESFVEQLIGEWSLLLWNARLQKLIAARDAMGGRPLYVYQDQNKFVAASQVSAVLAHPEIKAEINPESLLTMVLPARSGTMSKFKGIDPFPNGYFQCITSDGNAKLKRFWFPENIHRRPQSFEDCAAELHQLLDRATDDMLRTRHNHLGVLFSGGFDSSTIAALALPKLTDQNKTLSAFSSVPKSDFAGIRGDCSPWLDVAEKHFPDLKLHRVTAENLSIRDGFTTVFDQEWESGGIDSYYRVACMDAAKMAGVEYFVTGGGGDRGATPRGFGFLSGLLAEGQLLRLIQEAKAMHDVRGWSWRWIIMDELLASMAPKRLLHWYLQHYDWSRRKRRSGLRYLRPKWAEHASDVRNFIRHGQLPYAGTEGPGTRNFLLSLNLSTLRNGRAFRLGCTQRGMAFSDFMHNQRIAEFMLTTPNAYHVKNGIARQLIRAALKDVLPAELLQRDNRNDAPASDVFERVQLEGNQITRDLEELRNNASVNAFFDVDRIAKDLKDQMSDTDYRGGLGRILNGYCAANYAAWFSKRFGL